MYEYGNCVLLHRIFNQASTPARQVLTVLMEQHGFRPGRSTTTCFAVFYNYILEAFKAHSQVDVIFTDFSKAFDSVDHHILLCVLKATGFGELLLSWYCSFINDRKLFFKIHGVSSDILPIFSGVPQGGHHPSPLLFSVFLNSISSRLKYARLLAFADCIDSQNECFVLQDELNNIVEWANKPGLDFNIVKGFILYDLNTSFSVNGTTLQ
ncbi:hypothetical protein AGLY_017065 [Aphis glycines]|uniref:Reverse transcriptase domain-containing protein n=1 Tax=Aphis glycines TaxID=307491 RepID=A0A6G0SX59_APHGL|nr:hypothetical protein AGLY_017065 [Aphis glycines]